MTGPAPRELRGTGLVVRAGAATDVGRVRDHNEDAVLASGRVFAVCDGMGGHAAGEVASRLAVEALATLDEHVPQGADDVARALADANERILRSEAAHPGQRGMGTTAAGLVVVDAGEHEQWVVLNVGDSRVYRLAEGGLGLVTRDHSEVRELLDAGLIEPAEVATHPLRNVITRALGSDPGPEPDLWVLPPAAGERFVVCSDGLSNELADADIEHLLTAAPDPQAAADALVAAAVHAGGRDNVSVVVVAVDPAP